MESRGREPEVPRPPDADPRPPGPAAADRLLARRAVCRLLLSVARSDATITAQERAMLERYHGALDVPTEAEERLERSAEPLERVPLDHGRSTLTLGTRAEPALDGDRSAVLDLEAIPPAERIHVLRMMFRVAFADGSCSDVELALLRRLAGMMELSAVQFAEVHIASEREADHRRRSRRRSRWITGVVAVLVVTLGFVLVRQMMPEPVSVPAEYLTDTKRALEGLRQRIDRLDDADRAHADDRQLGELADKLERIDRELQARLELLERTGGERAPAEATATGQELAAFAQQLRELERRLAAFRAPQTEFQRLEQRFAASVLMIVTRYELVAGSDRRKQAGFGSGFFVTPGGLVVTNKHVVQPWKFLAGSVALLAQGYRLDEASVRTVAWTSGSRVVDESGKTVFDGAFDTSRGTLRIAALPPDRMEQRSEPLDNGAAFTGQFHAQDDTDLALLQAAVTAPMTPLPLAPDLSTVKKLDPVIVLGFPTGPVLLESGRAESSPSPGSVRKVDNSLFVTAPIVPGNSGGPVLDRRGRVIGIATRTAAGEATLGACIQSRHVLALLPAASVLVDEAARWIDGGHPAHARAVLELAEARGTEGGTGARIRELRRKLGR